MGDFNSEHNRDVNVSESHATRNDHRARGHEGAQICRSTSTPRPAPATTRRLDLLSTATSSPPEQNQPEITGTETPDSFMRHAKL